MARAAHLLHWIPCTPFFFVLLVVSGPRGEAWLVLGHVRVAVPIASIVDDRAALMANGALRCVDGIVYCCVGGAERKLIAMVLHLPLYERPLVRCQQQ